jgi:hypothetical protein
MAPVNVETPATIFPQQVLGWTSRDDMLDSSVAGTHDMFSGTGPAPAATFSLPNPDGSKLTDLETFDGSLRYFGSIMSGCEAALAFAVPYLTGTPYPDGVPVSAITASSEIAITRGSLLAVGSCSAWPRPYQRPNRPLTTATVSRP